MASTAAQHEIAFIESFIEKSRRKRYQGLRDSKRSKWLDRLNHCLGSELCDCYVVSEGRASQLISNQKLNKCWLFADSSSHDQTSLPLEEAISHMCLSDFGVIGSVVPGEIACFKAEPPSEIIWLFRPQ